MAEDKFVTDHKTETYKSMITISIEYYKAMLLLNGAAAAGIVAAIDKLARVADMHGIQCALYFFVGGLAADAFAMFTSWFVQMKLHNENIGNARQGSHSPLVGAAVLFSMATLVCFGAGAVSAVRALD